MNDNRIGDVYRAEYRDPYNIPADIGDLVQIVEVAGAMAMCQVLTGRHADSGHFYFPRPEVRDQLFEHVPDWTPEGREIFGF